MPSAPFSANRANAWKTVASGEISRAKRERGGAIGNRGPGETQLETDRRLLAERVKMLSKRLEKVQTQRVQQRRARLRNTVPRVALVGYTNAGKSTLFNVDLPALV